MNQDPLTRRRFVTALVALAAGAGQSLEPRLFSLGRAWAESGGQVDPPVRDAMVRMARLLFPHDSLSDDVYAGVLDQALADAAGGAAFAADLDAAAAALSGHARGAWPDLDDAAQIEALRGLEQEPWFAAIQDRVRAGIYMGAAFWKQMGYPGPSKGFGGYLNHGAGEIDWLGEDA